MIFQVTISKIVHDCKYHILLLCHCWIAGTALILQKGWTKPSLRFIGGTWWSHWWATIAYIGLYNLSFLSKVKLLRPHFVNLWMVVCLSAWKGSCIAAICEQLCCNALISRRTWLVVNDLKPSHLYFFRVQALNQAGDVCLCGIMVLGLASRWGHQNGPLGVMQLQPRRSVEKWLEMTSWHFLVILSHSIVILCRDDLLVFRVDSERNDAPTSRQLDPRLRNHQRLWKHGAQRCCTMLYCFNVAMEILA